MQTVQLTKLVSTENVKIHVLDCVVSMLIAESEIMFLFVCVTKDILETPSQVVTSNQAQCYQWLWSHATHLHVVSMLCALNKETEQVVPVSWTTLAIPMLSVSQSVLSMLSVPDTWPVLTNIVLTHVQGCVATTPLVMSTITLLSALVILDTLGMHSLPALESQHVRIIGIFQKDCIL